MDNNNIEEQAKEILDDEFKNVISQIGELSKIVEKKYNPELVDFNKGEQAFIITTDLKINPCIVSEINEKDENDIFSFQVNPLYKPTFSMKLKYFFSNIFGTKIKPPYPVGCVPDKMVAGRNIFKSFIDAYYIVFLINFITVLTTVKAQEKNNQKLN